MSYDNRIFVPGYKLNEFIQVFNRLMETDSIKDIELQFKIYKTYKQLQESIKGINDRRRNLESDFFETINDRLVVDENNNPKFKEGKTAEDYIKELDTILSEVVPISNTFSLTLEDLKPLAENGNLRIKDFEVLEDFIKED